MPSNAAPYILGFASSHNGGACLLKGEQVVAAIQEERLLRQKRAYHLGSRASLSVQYCLEIAGITASDLDMVVFASMGDNTDIVEDIGLNPTLRVVHNRIPTMSISHHLAHAVGAFATSGFRNAAVLVVDGCGSPVVNLSEEEQAAILPQYRKLYRKLPPRALHETISIFSASGITLTAVEKHVSAVSGPRKWPSSLGHIYEAVAEKIFGFGLEGAGKVMGLAPYGAPKCPANCFFDLIDQQFVFHEDALDRMCNYDAHWPSNQKEYSDLAASVQAALEVALLHLVKRASELTGEVALCFSGGVALNSIANERIHREGPFRNVFIMPAAEDSGTAVGAAYYGLWKLTGNSSHRRLRCDSLGRIYSNGEVENAIKNQAGIVATRHADVAARAAELIMDGAIIGWFQGGSELGPRALGQRSILCDPRQLGVKDRLNSKVKFREGFRPFAPAILQSHVREWFEVEAHFEDSPYMLRVIPIRADKRPLVPAVVHVDGTGRVQTVSDQDDFRFYSLINSFYEETGCPMVLNTSFNVAGEPIVESPADAIRCLLLTELDYCVINDFIIKKDSAYRSVFDFYPRLSTEILWMDALTRDSSTSVRLSRSAGLLRSFHFDYFGVVDIMTQISGRHRSRPLTNRTSDELTLNVGDNLARVVTRTRWGPIVHLLNLQIFELLRLIDGNLSCADLLLHAQKLAPDFFDQVTFVRSIASLSRASIVTLGAKPC